MKAITVKELTKKYKEHVAVDHLSFEVEEGELFAFLGENGAGKSTTINILCTILEKNAGDIEILGHELGREDDKIRDDIGIVFQNSVLDAKLTVKEKIPDKLIKDCKALKSAAWSHVFACWSCGTFFLVCF